MPEMPQSFMAYIAAWVIVAFVAGFLLAWLFLRERPRNDEFERVIRKRSGEEFRIGTQLRAVVLQEFRFDLQGEIAISKDDSGMNLTIFRFTEREGP